MDQEVKDGLDSRPYLRSKEGLGGVTAQVKHYWLQWPFHCDPASVQEPWMALVASALLALLDQGSK